MCWITLQRSDSSIGAFTVNFAKPLETPTSQKTNEGLLLRITFYLYNTKNYRSKIKNYLTCNELFYYIVQYFV